MIILLNIEPTPAASYSEHFMRMEYPLCSLFAMFTLLHSSTNQELFETYVCNQSSHYENMMAPHTPVIV